LTDALREAAFILVQIVAPMMPHLAEECWHLLGGQGLVAEAAWPKADRDLVIENEITLPIQINGKKRADITIARDADQKTVEAAVLALDVIQKALDNQKPKKIIIVPQRIVNVVV
jgi:leucyl-tRNA synthetase